MRYCWFGLEVDPISRILAGAGEVVAGFLFCF